MHIDDRHGGGLATVPLAVLALLVWPSGTLGYIYVQCSCMQIWIGRSRDSETVLQVVDLLVGVRLPVHLCVLEAS